MDRLDIYLKLLETEPEVRRHLIKLAGGPAQFAFGIGQELDIAMSAKDVAEVLKLSPSGTRKRIQKIKGKKTPKTDPESLQNAPKVTRKRPSRKRPK